MIAPPAGPEPAGRSPLRARLAAGSSASQRTMPARPVRASLALASHTRGNSAMSASKVAVVTGAGTGVGRAVSLALMGAGYAVVLAGRRKEPLEATAADGKAKGGHGLPVPTDVRDPAAIKALFARTKEAFG